MRLTILSLIIALVSAAFAGCIGGAEPLQGGVVDTQLAPDVVPPPANVTQLAATGIDVPTWNVGDAWTLETFETGDDEPCQLVVVAVGGTYTLAPTCNNLAQMDAVLDMSYIGPITADHLSGAQEGGIVRYFDFPLMDNKTWTTTWDGQEITLTATLVPNLMAPGAGAAPGFTVVGTTADGEPYVTYDYAPALKWVTHMEFAAGYGFRVTKFQEGWTGTYKTAVSKMVYVASAPSPGLMVPSTFTVSEGQTALLLVVAANVGGHTFAVNLIDPEGTTQYQRVESDQSAAFFDLVTLPAVAGEWKALTAGAYDPQSGGVWVDLSEVLVSEQTLA